MEKEFSFSEKFIEKLICKLDDLGCATEGDFIELYSVQYKGADEILNKMLKDAGYLNSVISIGYTYNGCAVYGVYDPNKIDYPEAMTYLVNEALRQNNVY